MAKDETIKEQIAIIRVENKYQTQSIDEMKGLLQTHIKSSEDFRDKCLQNETDIKWIRRIGKWTFGGGSVIAGVIAAIKKFGG